MDGDSQDFYKAVCKLQKQTHFYSLTFSHVFKQKDNFEIMEIQRGVMLAGKVVYGSKKKPNPYNLR